MKIGITETVLRDAQQSLIATRMRYDEFADILPTLDQVGYYSLECWGGATFDACMRYLNENPWQRLRDIRRLCPNTKLQMLLRGQNLLGYKPYPDDVVREFIKRAIGNGIDIIRVFDALNDLRNLETSVSEIVQQGGDAQVAIAYTTSPVHTLENYIGLASQIQEMGATSICIKDMSGIMTPRACEELVSAIKDVTDLRLHVHSHATTGMAIMSYLKGVEAGADVVDTAISAFSGGTSQPATETVVHSLTQFGFDTGINREKLKEVNDFFKPLRDKYLENGLLDPKVLRTDVDSLVYQVPGGMLSNLISQLKAAGQIDKLDQVLAEIPKVRADLGYPPLVTPTSQIVGAQATANVLAGERYKLISSEVKAYLRGEYGKAPGKVNSDLVAKALGESPQNVGRFADTLPDGLPAAAEEVGELAHTPEDVLSYALFPQVYQDYAANREAIANPNNVSGASPLVVAELPEPDASVNQSDEISNPSAISANSAIPGSSSSSYTFAEKYDVDDETAALLMAIVAYRLRTDPRFLSFKSIRERS